MKPLYTDEQFNSAKVKDFLPLQCLSCNKAFLKSKQQIYNFLDPKSKKTGDCCSLDCSMNLKHLQRSFLTNCKQCDKLIKVLPNILKHKGRKSNNTFCSQSCSTTYNNTHKKHGTRISKLEVWLQEQLTALYPNLEFHFNRKDTINSELDIYIPSLKLAFELNGIYHYEPIHGQDKLNQIQNNDNRKFAACIEQNISLCIIDSSKLSYFKPANAQKYLDIITNIISKNFVG